VSGREQEQYERRMLVEAQRMKDAAETKDEYTLRCINGEKVFFFSAPFALLPGQIYSYAGRDEFSISKCCEFHFDEMFEEYRATLCEVNGGIERVLYTVPNMADDYGDTYEARYATMNPQNADVISSEIYGEPGMHVVALDVDVPARLIPSSTEGHSHLHIDVKCSWEDYVDFLRAAEKIGIIEPGYVNVSIERRGTHLRLPWVKKEAVSE